MVLGLDVAGESMAFPRDTLQRVKVVNDRLGGQPVLVVHQPQSDTTTAFVARARDKTLTFKAANASVTELTDEQTASKGNAYGGCSAGTRKGGTRQAPVSQPQDLVP